MAAAGSDPRRQSRDRVEVARRQPATDLGHGPAVGPAEEDRRAIALEQDHRVIDEAGQDAVEVEAAADVAGDAAERLGPMEQVARPPPARRATPTIAPTASARTVARSRSSAPSASRRRSTMSRTPHGPSGPGMAAASSARSPGRTRAGHPIVRVTRGPRRIRAIRSRRRRPLVGGAPWRGRGRRSRAAGRAGAGRSRPAARPTAARPRVDRRDAPRWRRGAWSPASRISPATRRRSSSRSSPERCRGRSSRAGRGRVRWRSESGGRHRRPPEAAGGAAGSAPRRRELDVGPELPSIATGSSWRRRRPRWRRSVSSGAFSAAARNRCRSPSR